MCHEDALVQETKLYVIDHQKTDANLNEIPREWRPLSVIVISKQHRQSFLAYVIVLSYFPTINS